MRRHEYAAATREISLDEIVLQPIFFDGKATGAHVMRQTDSRTEQDKAFTSERMKKLVAFVIDNAFVR